MRDLARWLVEDGLITEPELLQAERLQEENSIPLSMALIELDLVGEKEIVEVVARRHSIPKAPRKLYKMTVPAKALSTIPQDHCWQHGLFPFAVDLPSKTLKVAILDPSDPEAMALLQRLPGGLEADLYIAGPKQLEKAIRKHFLDSIVEDTNAPGLRFFGYDNITSPGTGKGKSDGDDGSLEDIVFAEPDTSPPAATAPPPEPALNRGGGKPGTRSADEIPLPPSKPRTGEVHPAGKRRPPTGQARAVAARPVVPETEAPLDGATQPGSDGGKPPQVAIGRVAPADDRVAELEHRITALEHAVLELLELVARNSLDLSDRSERIAGELIRTSKTQ